MDFGGVLYMVVIEHEGQDFSDVSSDITVWKLMNNKWDDVSRVPTTLLNQCQYRLNRICHIECVGKGGVIFLTSARFFSEWLVLTYDIRSDKWSWMPQCKFSLAGRSRNIAAYEPCVKATV
ncbi:hypothetical protein KP509_12G068300 [Ceratopteris richardii]|uniref:Uncharacterized protein n=1 Tax=Ceratopteris richardii TaxID=49495 RepID=A0A8T2TLW2_CERRI|nr:hypothetical protein KP509_12G068300 [Ceratopteris richardii]